jgi:FlaA1/EpsC-like NDP-sugar epimerase
MSTAVRGFYGRVFGSRRQVQAAIDLVLVFLAVLGAALLRVEFSFADFSVGDFVVMSAIFTAAFALVALAMGLYRGRHPYAGHSEVLVLGVSAGMVAAALTVVNLAFPERLTPFSVPAAGGAFALLLMFFVRAAWRNVYDSWQRPDAAKATPVLIYGAGSAGHRMVEMLLNDPNSPYLPVGLLDDDETLQNLRVRGVRVLGTGADLERIAAETEVGRLVLAVPSADVSWMRAVTTRATDVGLQTSFIPQMQTLLEGGGVADLREVTEADLLGRGRIDTDVDSICDYVEGRRVLVTGAGGSIGSELCRQLSRFHPAELIMLDRDESALHAVQLSIDGKGQLSSRNLVVCNIRDHEALAKVFEEHKPDVVFHAAALKHVPLLEMWPAEGFKTNVLGSRNLLDLAVTHGVGRFVNISTDKAADPENVLGYTKRMAERLCADYATKAAGTFLSVRFGNVLGSRGSVLTAFRQQIAEGGPVTVTHPDVTRYFMTVQEAVQLVIQAGAVGNDGEALILDMGEPIRIADVAKRLVAAAPEPVDIVYTGLRPGEKMHEILMGEGEIDLRPAHPLISHVTVRPLANEVVDGLVSSDVVDLNEVDSWVDAVDTDVSVWLS